MKKRIVDIIQAGIKVILVCFLAIGTWIFLTPYFRTNKNIDGDKFRNIPDNCLDVIALGSSHIQYAFNPAVLYARTGYYSYVLGSSCQPMAMSVNMLKEALKTQHPSVVIVDVFTLLEQSEVCYADGMYYVAIDEMTGTNRLEAADKAPDSVRFQYKYDLYMNHNEWKNFDLTDISSITSNAEASDKIEYYLGHVAQKVESPRYAPLYVYDVTEEVELDDSAKDNLDDLIDLCESEDINLIFVKTPYVIDQESTNTLHAIWEYLDEKNCNYIDYIEKAEEINWFYEMDGDAWHNNSWGAEIITNDLASYILDNKLVKNHVDNDEYENIMSVSSLYTAKDLMDSDNVNIYNLLVQAKAYPSVVILNYKGNSHSSIAEYENKIMQDLGMTKDFINDSNSDYYAVIKDGKLIKESNEPFSLDLNNHKIEINEEAIIVDEDIYERSGEMQFIFMDELYTWLNEINIDYATKWFWKNGCDGFDCN